MKNNIIFFGTPEFSVPFLSKLIDAGYSISAVVTAPDKHVGRKKALTPSPVKVLAEKHAIRVFTPAKIRDNQEFLKNIEALNPDLGVVIAYGQIIPQELIDIPRLGIINVHPSQLPKYRGPSPMQWALLNGDEKTEIDIMQIDAGMDTGDVLFRKPFPIENGEHYQNLQERISHDGAQFLAEKMLDILNGDIVPEKQNDDKATYSKMIARSDGEVNPSHESAQSIHQKSRAFYPWPGVYTFLEGKRLKFSLPEILSTESDVEPGELFLTDRNECAIMCHDGFALIPQSFQLEGKKELSNADFVKGYSHLFQ